MIKKEKVIFCWSGGKDSALALYYVLQENKFEVIALLTTLNEQFKRISMHGVREELLDKQAESIGLPLIKMYVKEGTNAEYEKAMETLLSDYKKQGVSKIIFGDIFLEDLRAYRENNLAKVGLTAEFPLWKRDTKELIREFLKLNFKTITCCVNDAFLNDDSVGVEINSDFINSLPVNVDPCGENGEYHTFCFEGPIFKIPIKFSIGEKIYKPLEIKTADSDIIATKGFWFCELLPV
ncbi:MAG: ATP-binding protein [Bacteroidetes bacterium RIFCSPLOWO2_12_FULL_35_15]|nr:MAG: ATP-binding protein [Bacteroidetes bacterium RIFCSPLOWO2_12_FULL_35_15]